MANTIKLKRSSTASDTPTASDLEVGELAINTADAKLFTKHTDNSIKEISGTGGDVVDDTSPQLGGDLQSNGNDIDLADNDKLIAGTGGDLEFYHDGSNSYIDHVGADAQTLFIRNTTATSNSTDGISIQTKGSSPHYINMRNNAGLDLGVNGSDKMTIAAVGIYSNVGYILNSPAYEIKWRNTSNNTYLGLKGVAGTTADTTITLPNLTGTAVVEETGGVTLNNGVIDLKNGGTQSEVRLYCESSNAHYAGLKAPAHADFTGNVTSTLPAVTGTLIGTANADAPATTTSSSDADHVLVNDGGVLKKITPSDLGIGGGGGGSYANSDVDAHLNTSTASANEVLSWTGSDYDWVAQSGGGGGGSSNLTGLSDVNISSVSDGDLLRYNGTAGEWQNTNLGLTVTPSISVPSTLSAAAGAMTITITNHTTLEQNDVHYSMTVKRSSDNAVIVSPNSNNIDYAYDSTGGAMSTISLTTTDTAFGTSNVGVSYYIELVAQTFGDLQSEPATATFTIITPPQVAFTTSTYRYWRLTDYGAQVGISDWELFTANNQGGTAYPGTHAPSSNWGTDREDISWTSDGQTNRLYTNYTYPSDSYDVANVMDYSTTSWYWTLGNSSATANLTNHVTFDMGTARQIKSMRITFHDNFTHTVTVNTSFIVQGSSDGTNWTTVCTVLRTDEDFSASQGMTAVLVSDS